jgi:hypothetical protein
VSAVRVDLMPTKTASRTHCELFPHENRVTPVVLEELKQMIMHAAAGDFRYYIASPRAILIFVNLTVTITSVTSVAPFEKEELEKMLDLVMNIDGSFDEGLRTRSRLLMFSTTGTLEGQFTHTRCVVGMFSSGTTCFPMYVKPSSFSSIHVRVQYVTNGSTGLR